jgi:hypothetical protein
MHAKLPAVLALSGLVLPAILAASSLLASCTWFDTQPFDLNTAVLKGETYESQEALADYYAKAAADLQSRADEARALASQYEGKTYLYGNDGQDTVDRSRKLAGLYDRAAADNRRLADIHRRAAAQLPCKPVGVRGKGGLIPCKPSVEQTASDAR